MPLSTNSFPLAELQMTLLKEATEQVQPVVFCCLPNSPGKDAFCILMINCKVSCSWEKELKRLKS